jgi:hypothetical protein
MANRLDDLLANPSSGTPAHVERATASVSAPREHDDIFEVPTAVTPVPNLKPTSPRLPPPKGPDRGGPQRPALRASGTAPPATSRAPEPMGKPAPPRRVLPRAAGNRLPSPSRPRSVPVVTPPIASAPLRGPSRVEVDEATAIATPPPPPSTVIVPISRRAGPDVTQIVKPLPPPVELSKRARPESSRILVDDPDVARVTTSGAAPADTTRPRTHGKRIGVAALGGAVLVAAILVVVIGFSADGVTPHADRGPAPGVPEARPGASSSPAQASPSATSVPASPRPTSPTSPLASSPTSPGDGPPLDEIEMSPESADAAPIGKTPRPRPSRARPKHAQAKTARSTRPLTYDPDALFLNKP